MKIAFVNQPYDRIVPPHQSSVGLCTYGLSRALGKRCEVVIFGLRDRHKDVACADRDRIAFQFVSSCLRDRISFELRSRASKLLVLRSPISTSDWLYPEYAWQVALEIQKQRCDIVHIQQCSQWAPAIRALNPDTRIVLHLHAPWFSQSDSKILANRLQHVDLITTVSDFVASRVRRKFPTIADRCETVYNGVELEEFAVERDYSAKQSEKRILFVGAVSPHSGVHVLIDAFRIVEDKFPNVRLEIVGPQNNYPLEEVFDLRDWSSIQSVVPFYRMNYLSRAKAKLSLAPPDAGSYVAALRARVPTDVARKITFSGPIGDRSELVKRYYDADIFVFPPACDHGFGLPPLEAMASGMPVVASRSGALVETIANGRTGSLVAKNDASALAREMLVLLESDALREQMGRAARNRALTLFNWEIAAERFYRLYSRFKDLDQSYPLPGSMEESRFLPLKIGSQPARIARKKLTVSSN